MIDDKKKTTRVRHAGRVVGRAGLAALAVLASSLLAGACGPTSDCGIGGGVSGSGCDEAVSCGPTGEDARGGFTCNANDECTCTGDGGAAINGEGLCAKTTVEQALVIKNECGADFTFDRAFCKNDLGGSDAQCEALAQ